MFAENIALRHLIRLMRRNDPIKINLKVYFLKDIFRKFIFVQCAMCKTIFQCMVCVFYASKREQERGIQSEREHNVTIWFQKYEVG